MAVFISLLLVLTVSQVHANVITTENYPDHNGDDGHYEDTCKDETEYVYVKAVKKNATNNSDEHVTLVKVTKCVAAGKECGEGLILSKGLRGLVYTLCEQEYSDHRLGTKGPDGEETTVDSFKYPSGCSCMLHIQGPQHAATLGSRIPRKDSKSEDDSLYI